MSITMMKLSVILLASLISLSLFFNKVNAGVVHSYTNELQEEREIDGAYSPRDHSHFSGEGDHFSEFDHEAILGSHKEAQDYDHLPPEEAKRRLGILLKKMDINGNEQIDRQELKAWIIRSFKMLTEEEARERMEDADEDNDNRVTWDEYISDTYGFDSMERDVKFRDMNDKMIQDDEIMWKAADVSRDGVLDNEEWLAFTHPEDHPNMLPIILGQTLNDFDKDGDGFLSFQEYIGKRGAVLDKEALITEKVKFDDVLDKNHDGKLEGSEILSWVVPNNEEIASEEVDHLFAHSDDNHDNVLSFKEILDHQDTFVGSEATDYGDHLHNIHHFIDEL